MISERSRPAAGISGLLVPAALLLMLCACTSRYAIYSRPGGAEVYVDDHFVRRTVSEATPLRVDVSPGEHTIRVERDGYVRWSRRVDAIAGREVVVMADLPPIPPPPPHVPRGTLRISTDPGGARVYLDDDLLGRSLSDGRTPVIVEDLPPGSYEVTVARDGYNTFTRTVEVFAGEATSVSAVIEPLPGWWIYPTNADLMRRAVVLALREAHAMGGLRPSMTVAIANLAGDVDEDEPIWALVEDALVANLASRGVRVLERDDHLLVRIANEASRGDSFPLEVLTHHAGPKHPFVYDARMGGAAEVLEVLRPDGTGAPVVVTGRVPQSHAGVPTADRIIGYRLVEEGLFADPVDDRLLGEDAIRREARIGILCRVIDGRTGEILWSTTFTQRLVSTVPERVYPELASPHYSFFAYPYADSAPSEVEIPDIVLPWEPGSADSIALADIAEASARRLDDPDGAFWYFRNMGEGLLRRGRFGEARDYLSRAETIKPDDYETHMMLAEAVLRDGDLDGAREEYLDAYRSLVSGGD